MFEQGDDDQDDGDGDGCNADLLLGLCMGYLITTFRIDIELEGRTCSSALF